MMKLTGRYSGVVFLLLLLAACGPDKKALSVKDVPDPKQTGGGYVSNPDQLLSVAAVDEINATLASLDQSGIAQVAVVFVRSIGEQVPKDFAVELFNTWGIGAKGIDNGLLILVVEDQRRIEFETGYGLESTLTDLLCYRIQQDYMVPYMRSNEYDRALINGVNAVAGRLTNVDDSDGEVADTDYEDGDTTTVVTAPDYAYEDPLVAEAKPVVSWSNALEVIANSFVSFIILTVITLIVMGMDLPKKVRDKDAGYLFKNDYYQSFALSFFTVVLGAVAFFELMFLFLEKTDLPFYITVIAFYLGWCLFVHVYYLVILPVRTVSLATLPDKHLRHEKLAKAYRFMKRFSWVFPLPFLAIAWQRHRAKLSKWRNEIQVCNCGKAMHRLDEVEDDRFLDRPQLVEEQMRSVDYDVWICFGCNSDRVLRYEDYTSGILVCDKCKAKTLKKTGNEVVEEATYSSSGYGYRIYDCQHCQHRMKIKYTIPKKTKSSSGSGGGSSGGGSWGGGSSGGGGAGSSW